MATLIHTFRISLLFSFLSIHCSAQMRVQLVDELGMPVVGVKSFFRSKAQSFIFRAVSNENGEITIPLKTLDGIDSLYLSASTFGFVPLDTFLCVQPVQTVQFTPLISEQSEVVVTAQYGQQTADKSVHRIKVIDRAKIESMGAVTLKDVLTNELGVRLAQDNILGSDLSLQGISGENVKILIDGVPVVGRLNGNIDISQINLQEIDHIEIVEGPLSVNYGTNALAGVVNLISKKPSFNKINGSFGSYYESSGHYNLTTDLNYGNKFHSFGISLGRNFFDGWNIHHTTFQNPLPIADSNRFMSWKPKEQLFGGVYYQWNRNGWLLRYKLNGFDEDILNRGYPRPPYQETAFDDKYHTRRIDNAFTVKKNISGKGIINLLASYNRYDREKSTYFVDLTTLNQQLTNNPSDQDTSAFDQWVFRGNYASSRDSSKINYQLGFDILIESAEGKRILNHRKEQGDVALFATAEYQPFRALVIRPGIRYAYNTTYRTPLLPSLNLKWALSKTWNLRTSYARGFCAPGIKELYFEFVDINHNIIGNDELTAESSNNFSASLLHSTSIKKGNLENELSGFYNAISNKITLASSTGTEFSYVNIGAFQSTGARYNLRIKSKQLNASAGIGWIGQASDLVSASLATSFLFYPEVQSSVIYTIAPWKTSIALFYKYNGKLPRFFLDENEDVQEGITQDYHLLDLTLTKRLFKERVSLVIGSKNVLNITSIATSMNGAVHSEASSSIAVGTGRTYFASLQVNFKKSLKPVKK